MGVSDPYLILERSMLLQLKILSPCHTSTPLLKEPEIRLDS